MSATTTAPAQLAREFFDAWSSRDIERSMSFVADDIVVDSPNGRIEGADAYKESLLGWFAMFTKADILDVFGEGDRAIMIYECSTGVVAHVPAVEYFAFEDGKINYKRLVFDRAPFMQASQS